MIEGAALPQPGDTVADKYRIECTIGVGGMSVIFGATHLVTGRRFAIKWLSPEAGQDLRESTQRFIREAQVAGRFAHPNVVEVYDVGPPDRAHYMVMEWLDGESLAAKLEREGCISFADACEILIPCMHGIDDAHHAGIVHRDLKPANIFVCSATRHAPARAKVLDFGISKLMDAARSEFNPFVTKVGTIIGTPYYVAPEQLRGQAVDQRADVYAFGVILYEVLSGMVPFPALSFSELAAQIAAGTPKPLRELVPTLPPHVEHVVAKAMARELEDRYQDVRSLIVDVERLLANEEPVLALIPRASASDTQAGSTPYSTGRMSTPTQVGAGDAAPVVIPKSFTWAWLIGALVAVAAGSGLYQLWSGRVGAPSQTVRVQAVSDLPPTAAESRLVTQASQAEPVPRANPLNAANQPVPVTGPVASPSAPAQPGLTGSSLPSAPVDEAHAPPIAATPSVAPAARKKMPRAETASASHADAPVGVVLTADDPNDAHNPLHMQLQ